MTTEAASGSAEAILGAAPAYTSACSTESGRAVSVGTTYFFEIGRIFLNNGVHGTQQQQRCYSPLIEIETGKHVIRAEGRRRQPAQEGRQGNPHHS